MSTETILLRLRRAASVTNSQGDRLQYRAAADRISLLIAALRSTPTNDAMRDLNGAWAHATRLLLKPLAGGDTPPTSGRNEARSMSEKPKPIRKEKYCYLPILREPPREPLVPGLRRRELSSAIGFCIRPVDDDEDLR